MLSSAYGAGGREKLPPVIGRKGETESEREKQLKVNCLSIAKGRTLMGPEWQRAGRVSRFSLFEGIILAPSHQLRDHVLCDPQVLIEHMRIGMICENCHRHHFFP